MNVVNPSDILELSKHPALVKCLIDPLVLLFRRPNPGVVGWSPAYPNVAGAVPESQLDIAEGYVLVEVAADKLDGLFGAHLALAPQLEEHPLDFESGELHVLS